MSGPSNPFDLKDSRYLHTDEGPNYDRSSHLTVSALNPNKENNSTNKKSNQLNIEVSLNAYDSNQSTNRLNPDSNRNLLMSTRNSKFVSTPGSDNHNFDFCTTSQRSQGQELP